MLTSIFFFITYQIITLAILPLIPIYLIFRKLKKKPVFGNFKERIGFIPKNKTNTKTIWIHAVSVGEILSIQNLIDEIKNKSQEIICYVTTGTITGKNMAKKNLNCDYISFLPYDFLLPMLITFKRIKPTSIIIVEAETWPNLLFLARFKRIPMYMINARIYKKSESKYKLFKFFFKKLFDKFNLILTQSNDDTKRFNNIGIHSNKIKTLGNIKTLNVLIKKNKESIENGKNKYPTLLAGSIHPGELNTYIELFKKLKADYHNLKMILVPRHFHWKKKLINKIEKEKISFYFWNNKTQVPNKEYIKFINEISEKNDLIIVYKLGELFKLYKACNIFFLGGTFVPIGGHNLLEPSVWKKPSIIGPYYNNCKDIVSKLKNNNGILFAKNKLDLYINTKNLLNNTKKCFIIGNNSFEWLQKESFVVKNMLNNLIKNL